jgi:hypothetical protein
VIAFVWNGEVYHGAELIRQPRVGRGYDFRAGKARKNGLTIVIVHGKQYAGLERERLCEHPQGSKSVFF